LTNYLFIYRQETFDFWTFVFIVGSARLRNFCCIKIFNSVNFFNRN